MWGAAGHGSTPLDPPHQDVGSPHREYRKQNTEPSETIQPCIGKTQEQCQQITADFAERRRQIEAKRAKTIDQQRRFYCTGYGASPPCNVVKKSQADRDEELSTLEAELTRQLSQ
jgi:hypothetical protein